MVSEKIRRVRKGVERAKERVGRRRERARNRVSRAKQRVTEPVKQATQPVAKEASATRRELRLLGQEIGEPVQRAAQGAQSRAEQAREAVGSARESAAAIEERFDDLQAIEQDTLGMAGEDFGLDLEVVDDLERGENMEGMGDAGFDTTFDTFEAPLSSPIPGANEVTTDDVLEGGPGDLDVVGEAGGDDFDDILEDLK